VIWEIYTISIENSKDTKSKLRCDFEVHTISKENFEVTKSKLRRDFEIHTISIETLKAQSQSFAVPMGQRKIWTTLPPWLVQKQSHNRISPKVRTIRTKTTS